MLSAFSGLRRAAIIFLPALLISCSDSSDRERTPARDWQLDELLALVPEPAAATMYADAVALEQTGEGGIARLLEQPGEPAIARIAGQLRVLLDGIDGSAELRRLVLAQSGQRRDEYLLLADTHANSLQSLYAAALAPASTRYRQVDLYQHPSLDLHIGMLPGALLAMGSAASLHAIIDQLRDGTPAASGASIRAESAALGFYLQLATGPAEDGALALSAAHAVSGAFNLQGDTLAGSVRIDHGHAREYVERFNTLAGETTIAPLETDGDNSIIVPVELSLDGPADRFYISRLFQAFDGVSYAEGVALGANVPWLDFDVGTAPNSIFINFEFASKALRQQFEDEELPQGFRLAPLRILDGDAAGYFLVLNVYQSSGGLVQGARAEWSVFVQDPVSGIPRFLVIEALADNIAADPVNLLTFPEPVSHVLEDGQVVSYVGNLEAGDSEGFYFRSAFDWPLAQAETRGFAREFVAANDFIFWGNAVADRGTFNGTVYARDAVVIPPSALALADNSRWSKYLQPQPRHALVYQNALEIIISPWWNLGAGYLDVTPVERQQLGDFFTAFYPSTMLTRAESAFRGEGSVVYPVEEKAGSLYLHFAISDPQGMQASLDAHPGLQLAPVALTDAGQAQYLLTLHISRLQDDACGVRADWVTYVASEQTPGPQALKLLTHAAAPCLDVDALLSPASSLALINNVSQVRLRLWDLLVQLEATVDPALAQEVSPGLQWLQSQDQLCGLSGVCDRRFIDGETLNKPLQGIDPSAIAISELRSPWDAYIDHAPLAVWRSSVPRLRVEKPWDSTL